MEGTDIGLLLWKLHLDRAQHNLSAVSSPLHAFQSDSTAFVMRLVATRNHWLCAEPGRLSQP